MIVKQAISFWDKSTNYMDPIFRAANDYERMFRCLLPKELETAYAQHADRSALAPVDVYLNIQSLKAHLYNIMFSTKPYGSLSIQGQHNNRSEGIKKAEQVLQYMQDIAVFEEQADLAHHQALIFGITAVFTRWNVLTERVPVRDEKTYQLVLDDNDEVQWEMKPVAQYAETIPIDFRRVRIDPAAGAIGQKPGSKKLYQIR